MKGGTEKSPLFFASAADLRAWLEENHASVSELWVGFYNQRSGRKGITYREALDEALCFGWIDGVRKTVDEGRYKQRFTPRRAKSVWSLVNIERVGELRALGRMAKAGLAVFEGREEKLSGVHSVARANAAFTGPLERRLRANARAFAFFEALPPGYRHLSTWFVMSAKKDETRLRRLDVLIRCCEKGKLLPGLARPAKSARRKG
jgi:uncharacterized protein YdeI (YjbR/CyaY-like superfamily)